MLSLLLFFLHRVFLPPFLFILFLVLCLASFGKSLGIRRLYVKTLLKVFQVSAFDYEIFIVIFLSNFENQFWGIFLLFSLQPKLQMKPGQNKEEILEHFSVSGKRMKMKMGQTKKSNKMDIWT